MNSPIDLGTTAFSKIKVGVTELVISDNTEIVLARNLLQGPVLMGVCFAMAKRHPNSRFWTPRVSWKALWITEAVATGLALTGYVLEKMAEREFAAEQGEEA